MRRICNQQMILLDMVINGGSENLKWKTPIPGKGHATPIVWENQIILLTAVATEDKEASIEQEEEEGEGGDKGKEKEGEEGEDVAE